MPTLPSFLIVGTPRSGTTIVQRLASELPGVHVPPETHFFDLYVTGLIQRRSFPLERRELDDEVRRYLAMPTSSELGLEPAAVTDRLGGRCDSPLDLFAAIVEALAPDATIRGEKTPDHLRWWRPLARSLPDARIVAVVRDPRAVVASNRKMPWGAHPHGFLAEAWRLDVAEVGALSAALPVERRLVLRYEDVVRAPDDTRAQLARLLGVEHAGTAHLDDGEIASLFQPGEWWKEKVRGPISDRWIDQWRSELTDEEARDVALVCADEMARLGYDAGPPNGAPRPDLDEQREHWRAWLATTHADVAEYERRFVTQPRAPSP